VTKEAQKDNCYSKCDEHDHIPGDIDTVGFSTVLLNSHACSLWLWTREADLRVAHLVTCLNRVNGCWSIDVAGSAKTSYVSTSASLVNSSRDARLSHY
jgi:hypothetical protein